MKQIGKPYQRPGKSGWWLRWTDPVTRKRITKSFPTKALAEHFHKILYHQLNSDVFIGAINIPLEQAAREYLEKYDLRHYSKAAKVDASATLSRLIKCLGNVGTKHLAQPHFDAYIRDRSEGISPWTLNKDIGNLKAFLAWATKKRYIKAEIELCKVKTGPLNRRALTTEQIRALFAACPTPAWRVRILLSLVTGLRSSDIDSLPVAAIDLERATIDTQSQKTSKAYIGRPLPKSAIHALSGYVGSLPGGRANLFVDVNTRKVWDSFRGSVTRQDLRRTFSTLMQKIGGIGSAQNLLEHSDSRTTTDFYTDQELILRWKVNQLPVAEWLTVE